jgi:hypothetical protein
MQSRRLSPPAEIKEIIALIDHGRLFDVQEWVSGGKPIRCSEKSAVCPNLLERAVDSGFHSMVVSLLKALTWSPLEMTEALESALRNRRIDLAELLLDAGAPVAEVDFVEVCSTMNVDLMERMLRAGADPARDNAFARALLAHRAKPLLRFYRQVRDQYPTLHAQASLALSESASKKDIRWTALLRWAGADPFMKVPGSVDSDWNDLAEMGTTAAFRGVTHNFELYKALNLKPTPNQALDLLSHIGWWPCAQITEALLSFVPNELLNQTGSSQVISSVLRRPRWEWFGLEKCQNQDAEALKVLELLLDRGARWNPDRDDLRDTRRNLLTNDPKYIIQVLRLLIYTQNAASLDPILSFCDTTKMRGVIIAADPRLWAELMDLRRDQRCRCKSQKGKGSGVRG